MRKSLLLVIAAAFFNLSYGQLTKGVWLVGGTGSFSSTESTYSSTVVTQTSEMVRVNISPTIGHFVFDKFAVGLRPGYSKSKGEVTSPVGGNTNVNRLDVGPFARYYFLDAEKPFNLLTEVSYQYGFYWFTPTKGHRNTVSAMAGTVVFFNSAVGLEFLLGYCWQTENINDAYKAINKEKGLQMTIGFQFHLEKE